MFKFLSEKLIDTSERNLHLQAYWGSIIPTIYNNRLLSMRLDHIIKFADALKNIQEGEIVELIEIDYEELKVTRKNGKFEVYQEKSIFNEY